MATGSSNRKSFSSASSIQPPTHDPLGVSENLLGYDCEFVEPPPKTIQYDCPVCLLVMRDPHQAPCCGYSFCATCIKRIQESEKCCPTCNKTDFPVFPDTRLRLSLYDFTVYCSKRSLGCEWEGKLRALERHLNLRPSPETLLEGCQFSEVVCIHCLQPFQRCLLQTHQFDDCPKRPFACQHCNQYKATFEEISQSHWPVCSSFPLHCPNNCDLVLQRREIEQHVRQDCPLTLLDCDFQIVGCAVCLPRRDMPSHINENIACHMSQLEVHVITHPEENIATCMGLMVGVIQRLFKENACTRSQLHETKKELQGLQELRDQLKTSHDKKCSELQQVQQQFITLQQSVVQQKHGMTKMTGTSIDHQQSLTELEERVPRSKENSTQTEFSSGPMPFNFSVTEFENEKENAAAWYSAPFYTHIHGYRMCIAVYANGTGNGKGTHLSVFCRLMQGPFDDYLPWPFQGTIIIQLLNQLEDKKHYTTSINFSDATKSNVISRVTSGMRANTGWGKPTLLSHAKLGINIFKKCQYLKDDQLKFRICNVTFPPSNS